MTLDDFKGREWDTLTDEEKRRAVLMIQGYSARFIHGVGWHAFFDNEYYYAAIPRSSEKFAWSDIANPLIDPGAAMELFKSKAVEYSLDLSATPPYINDTHGFICEYRMERPTVRSSTFADTPELAISEAVYRAWQARQEVAG